MGEYAGKNFPQPSPETRVYWEACRQHQLKIQQCKQCAHYQFYPRIICTNCMSENVEWIEASGHGEVTSFTIVRRPVSKAYADETPYVVALIKLTEGPTMMSNIVGCDVEQVEIGMAVKVVFEDWSEEISVPKFQPIQRVQP